MGHAVVPTKADHEGAPHPKCLRKLNAVNSSENNSTALLECLPSPTTGPGALFYFTTSSSEFYILMPSSPGIYKSVSSGLFFFNRSLLEYNCFTVLC